MSTFELSQIIVENGITTRTEFLEFAEELCGEEKTDIAEFVVNPGVASCCRGSSNSLGSKTGEENFESSRKSRLDILEAALAGDCISDCNEIFQRVEGVFLSSFLMTQSRKYKHA